MKNTELGPHPETRELTLVGTTVVSTESELSTLRELHACTQEAHRAGP